MNISDMILLLSFLSTQKQRIVQFNCSFISMLCVLWAWHVYSSMFRGVYAAFHSCTVSPYSEFCQRKCSIPVLSRAVELSRFILCLR